MISSISKRSEHVSARNINYFKRELDSLKEFQEIKGCFQNFLYLNLAQWLSITTRGYLILDSWNKTYYFAITSIDYTCTLDPEVM